MNINYQKARNYMVENQLKPNKIKDEYILNIFKEIPKENFLTDIENLLPYSDMDIKLTRNRGYLKNLHIAQLIKNLDMVKGQKVLHVGALTGYVTSILASFSNQVFAIETDAQLKKELKINTKKYENIEMVEGDFIKGCSKKLNFDRILIDLPIKNINQNILNQLSGNFGKLIIVKKINNHLSQAIKITKNINNFSEEYLFDVFSSYELYSEKEEFVF